MKEKVKNFVSEIPFLSRADAYVALDNVQEKMDRENLKTFSLEQLCQMIGVIPDESLGDPKTYVWSYEDFDDAIVRFTGRNRTERLPSYAIYSVILPEPKIDETV